MSTVQTEHQGTMKNKITKNEMTNLFYCNSQALSYCLHETAMDKMLILLLL